MSAEMAMELGKVLPGLPLVRRLVGEAPVVLERPKVELLGVGLKTGLCQRPGMTVLIMREIASMFELAGEVGFQLFRQGDDVAKLRLGLLFLARV